MKDPEVKGKINMLNHLQWMPTGPSRVDDVPQESNEEVALQGAFMDLHPCHIDQCAFPQHVDY